MSIHTHLPTILLLQEDRGFRDALVLKLEQEGYMVLPASGPDEALHIVRTHSRNIDLLLIAESATNQTTAAALKQYRRFMDILFLGSTAKAGTEDRTSLDLALAKVREVLALPEERGPGRSQQKSKSAVV
jgi:CheY-like chemotaxis protein